MTLSVSLKVMADEVTAAVPISCLLRSIRSRVLTPQCVTWHDMTSSVTVGDHPRCLCAVSVSASLRPAIDTDIAWGLVVIPWLWRIGDITRCSAKPDSKIDQKLLAWLHHQCHKHNIIQLSVRASVCQSLSGKNRLRDENGKDTMGCGSVMRLSWGLVGV